MIGTRLENATLVATGLQQRVAERTKQVAWLDTMMRRNPLRYGRARSLLDRLQAASLEERRAWESRRLPALLRRAARTRYGRSVGGGTRISSWPVLDKQQVREHPDAFLAIPQWMAAPAETSGTTGTPLRLSRSLGSVAVEQACWDWLLDHAGVHHPETARLAILRDDRIKDIDDQQPPYWRYSHGGRRLVFSTSHLSFATAPAYADAIEALAPTCLLAFPSTAESLAYFLARAGRQVRLPVVVTTSEVLPPATRALIAATFGARVVDQYGQAERTVFAYSLEPGEYRLLPGYAHLELRERERRGAVTLYEVISTGLWNEAMPLVRYRTGDLLRLPTGLDESALARIRLGLDPFDGVEGRAEDYLYAPNGARLCNLGHVSSGVRRIIRLQLVQERLDYVRMRVVPADGFSADDAALLVRNAHDVMPASMRVDLEVVDQVERTRRGKAPYLVRRPAVEAAVHSSAICQPWDTDW